ncbi:MAG: ribonuclease HI [Pseudanabaenaceae cyanobacterium]
MKQVEIYTDGACLGNPGPGGYGAILICGDRRKELSGGFRLTTNNRMELMGAIAGLQALNYPCQVNLYSDSKYLVDAINLGWLKQWQAKGKLHKRPNHDLWLKLLELCDRHQVNFIWIKGHGGHPENERCDFLAVQAYQQPNLSIDLGYENQD